MLLLGASVCVSITTAWVLFHRAPGSLRIAQVGLVVRAVLVVLANVSLPMMAGLPADLTEGVWSDVASGSFIVVLLTGVWYLYLLQSVRVREIYAA